MGKEVYNFPMLIAFGFIIMSDFLTGMFFALKIKNVLTWPWIWVLAPFWGQFVVAALGGLFLVMVDRLKRKD